MTPRPTGPRHRGHSQPRIGRRKSTGNPWQS